MTVFDFNLLRHFGHDTPRFSRDGMANERWNAVNTAGLDRSLYEILQILSLTLFEKTPNLQAFSASYDELENTENHNQLLLFDL